ncbi:peroxidase-like [Oppia nitens]|uniref:peroxidase-like n=1 Tax=Oppia nitens TaxID=1686743 RepID=UPI0023D9DF45|nr:peroxidase-like [Oppia nitens]
MNLIILVTTLLLSLWQTYNYVNCNNHLSYIQHINHTAQPSQTSGAAQAPSFAKSYPSKLGEPQESIIGLDNIQLPHFMDPMDGLNLVEHVETLPNWGTFGHEPKQQVLIKPPPQLLSVPVARDILFSSDGKYVPFDIDHKNIYRHYLRSDLYLLDCQSYADKPETPAIMMEDLHEAFRYADSAVQWYSQTIQSASAGSTTMDRYGRRRPAKSPTLPNGVLPAKFLEYTSQFLLSKKCISKYDASALLPKIDVQKVLLQRYRNNDCSSAVMLACDPNARFRTIDGSCNNLRNQNWARANSCHRRLLPPDYADGIEVPRVAHDGSDLPNVRLLSNHLLPDIPIADNKLTSMTMAFGQFIVHDIARTAPFPGEIQCCPGAQARHPECIPIEPLHHDDFLFQAYNQTCINLVRSTICNPCSLGPREQQNQATQVFDMSQIYGLNANESFQLRQLEGGKLTVMLDARQRETLPPAQTNPDSSCNMRPSAPRFRCFQSGDGIRASQHPALQSLHVTFHRRHNRHAEALASVNPHWDDERLYQESRRLLIAEENAIIYGEYLPAIMGKTLTKHFDLDVQYSGHTTYDPTTNPSTIQEYIVAAGRFGHSQINEMFKVLLGAQSYSFLLRENFFEPTAVSLGHTGGILKGLVSDPTASMDPFFTGDVKNFLYKSRTENFGRDLPAFNIQRGRDHGVPGYAYYLDYCFGFKVKSWNDLLTFIPKKQLKKIQTFYKHWRDIDLFVGGVSERRISDAAFGPTFACINGIQFYHFKFGDRFYFEHGYQPGSFSQAQLDNIRKSASLANIICKTSMDVHAIQPNVFFHASPHNPLMPCQAYPEIDYSLWAESPYPASYHL